MHTEAFAAAHVPAGHTKQMVAVPWEKFPLPHALQVPAPDEENSPGWHPIHVEELALAYFPPGQVEHVDALAWE